MLLFIVNVMYNVKDSFQLQTRKIKIILITIPVQEKFQLLDLRDRKNLSLLLFRNIEITRKGLETSGRVN